MLRTLPMLEIEPSTFCAIWVSISLGAAPGCAISTFTSGYAISGFRLIGRRTKAMTPRKNSTTNNTIGVIGCRIAQEEQHHEQHHRCDRMPNRPGGNVLHELPAVLTT